MITPNSDQEVPGFFEVEEDLYEPSDPQSQSDDYKDMLIEMHSFAKR